MVEEPASSRRYLVIRTGHSCRMARTEGKRGQHIYAPDRRADRCNPFLRMLLSLAAYTVSFHGRHPVAATIYEIASTAEMRSKASRARKGTNVFSSTACFHHAKRTQPECVFTAIGQTKWYRYG